MLGAGWSEADTAEALRTFEEVPSLPSTEFLDPVNRGQETTPRQEPSASPVAATKLNVIERFFDFFKAQFKQPRAYYVPGAIFLIIIAAFLYPKFFLKEELSEFELTP
ncbi:MAG: hypothetical protein COT37_00805, partial [Parcubacteria group bacterium CG08_land_8_20_14_0_20_43_9]